MHRRTPVPHRTLARNLSARTVRTQCAHTRPQFAQPATTESLACRYRLGRIFSAGCVAVVSRVVPASGVVPANTQAGLFGTARMSYSVANAPQFVAKPFDRCEHQDCGLRRKSGLHPKPTGIAPDVVRPELDSPSQPCSKRFSQHMKMDHVGVCFLPHFSLVQPYF